MKNISGFSWELEELTPTELWLWMWERLIDKEYIPYAAWSRLNKYIDEGRL